MKAKAVSKSCPTTGISPKKFPSTAVPRPAASHFNARGIVDDPEFVLDRSKGAKDQIDITVRSHSVGDHKWIAEADWVILFGHPHDSRYGCKSCDPIESKASSPTPTRIPSAISSVFPRKPVKMTHGSEFRLAQESMFAKTCQPHYHVTMTTMNISLPETLKAFVDTQASQRGFSTSSEYVRELIRRDQDRQQLRGLLLAGAGSSPTTPVNVDYFDSLRSRVHSAQG